MTSGDTSHKLLLTVSDGRGIFAQGRSLVADAIKRARQCGLVVILIIVDNPKAEQSITDIKVTFSYFYFNLIVIIF